jgi:splicing factor 3B subunit 2
MRERVQPKMGKLDIDYQKLHDAFFRFQTKPQLTMYGEVYYEGKEYETNLKDRRPGELSEELKEALNIPPGAPPPWLINMQRFGPPPSYPSLKIPGLNAPIPPGAQWGFHPGGYGKPPTDEYNRPLYGDVFGVLQSQAPAQTGEPNREDSMG